MPILQQMLSIIESRRSAVRSRGSDVLLIMSYRSSIVRLKIFPLPRHCDPAGPLPGAATWNPPPPKARGIGN